MSIQASDLIKIDKNQKEIVELLRQILEVLRMQLPYVVPNVPYDPQPYYPQPYYPYAPTWSEASTKEVLPYDEG